MSGYDPRNYKRAVCERLRLAAESVRDVRPPHLAHRLEDAALAIYVLKEEEFPPGERAEFREILDAVTANGNIQETVTAFSHDEAVEISERIANLYKRICGRHQG